MDQEQILHDAARACGLDGHIQHTGSTAAERAMVTFGARRDQPRKMSYLYLDAVDACFYIQSGRACCVLTARWFAGSKDLDKLDGAGKLIKQMLVETQRRIDKEGNK